MWFKNSNPTQKSRVSQNGPLRLFLFANHLQTAGTTMITFLKHTYIHMEFPNTCMAVYPCVICVCVL